MTRWLWAFIFLVGCDKEISREREYLAPPAVELRELSCTYSCYRCGLDFDGDFRCGPELCYGRRPAMVQYQPYMAYYESGKVKRREETHVLSYVGSCS